MKIYNWTKGIEITKAQTKDFGLVMVLIISFLAFHFKDFNYIKAAIALALLTILLPVLLYPFAYCWFGLGKILGAISSAILLTAIYFIIVIPIGIIRRIAGYDNLKLKQFKKGNDSVLMLRDHVFNENDLVNTF
jgi:prepilin signal peptidase PulO-like enzyme (type II secretory pathway)